ncbi:hypothetical protein FACS1894111_02240 [Clostridia bacterium]|nr:hypothetical protein FACS1894111_02240 [Clostridia bacterium]
MNTYERPVIVAVQDIAEGVFMASGGSTEESKFSVTVKKYSDDYTYTISNVSSNTTIQEVKDLVAAQLGKYVPDRPGVAENINDYKFAVTVGIGAKGKYTSNESLSLSSTLGEVGIGAGGILYMVYKK